MGFYYDIYSKKKIFSTLTIHFDSKDTIPNLAIMINDLFKVVKW